MYDPHLGRIFENVRHLECNAHSGDFVAITSYESLRNPYSLFLRRNRPKLVTPEDMKIQRRESALLKEREHILHAELASRTNEISAHKYFASETMGYDVGLLMGAAAWLSEYGEQFYSRSEAHYKELGKYFEWTWMEKAIIIAAPNKESKEVHFVIVKFNDMHPEENMAQAAGGVTKNVDRLGQKARSGLAEYHKVEHVCPLGAPQRFWDGLV